MDKKGLAYLKKDKHLRKIIGKVSLSSLEKERDVFQDLVRSVIGQQLSVKAASTIYGRFKALFTKKEITPRKILRKSHEELRNAGLSNAKAKYIREVALFSLKHNYDIQTWRKMEDESALQLLTEIKGVGIWTAQMILMFSMHRPDVFPLKDVGIQNGIKKLCKLKLEGKELEEKMIRLSKPWRPYRSLACRLLWAYLDNEPD